MIFLEFHASKQANIACKKLTKEKISTHVWLSDTQEYTDGQNYLSGPRTTDAQLIISLIEPYNFWARADKLGR